jgi:hypothetical protein
VDQEQKPIIAPEQILKLLGIEYFPKASRLAFCCPIHDDRDPSAGFYLTTSLAHCFSCDYTLPPHLFYAKVKNVNDGVPWKDSLRDLEKIFGVELQEESGRGDRHTITKLRNQAEAVLRTARHLPRQDHAAMAETFDRTLLAYERGGIDKLKLDTALEIWYNRVREAKNVGSYRHRLPEVGPHGRVQESPGDISGPGPEADGRAVAGQEPDESIDLD